MTRLLQLSDLRFGAEIPAAVDALVEATETLRPDQVLIGGDFAMRARRAEWRAARQLLDLLPLPVGSHDIVLSHVSTACSHRIKGEPPGFHLIELDGKTLTITPHHFHKNRSCFRERGARKFHRKEGNWTTASKISEPFPS